MQPLKELLQKNKQEIKGSERSEVIKELYGLYCNDVSGRKKDNWRRYVTYLKTWQIRDTDDNQKKFKKSTLFLKVLNIKRFCYIMSIYKMDDLYYLLSVAKDKNQRGESVGGFLIGNALKK